MGDLVHDLRSALDHLVYAFAATQVAAPEDTQFPILDKEPDHGLGSYWRVASVPERVVTVIDAMQPYSNGTLGGFIGRGLANLRDLSNRDKHRVLLVAGGFVDTKHVVAYTDRDVGSVVEYDRDPDRLWAEVSFPADEPEGTYLPHFRAEVTMIEEGLPWRSGVTGIARALYTATTAAIGAFTPLWDLLPGQDD